MRVRESAAAATCVVVGFAVALTTIRIIPTPFVQSIVIALVAWIGGSLVGAALWLTRPTDEAPICAVRWPTRRVLLTTAVVVVLAMVAHGLAYLVELLQPTLGSWKHLLIGVGSSIAGCAGFTKGFGFGEPVNRGAVEP